MIDEMFTGPARRLVELLEEDVPKGLAELARQVASLEATPGSPRLRPRPAGSSVDRGPAGPTPSPSGDKRTGVTATAST